MTMAARLSAATGYYGVRRANGHAVYHGRMDRVDRGGIASDAIIFEDLEDEERNLIATRAAPRGSLSYPPTGSLPFSAIFRREHMQQLRPRPPWLMLPGRAQLPRI